MTLAQRGCKHTISPKPFTKIPRRLQTQGQTKLLYGTTHVRGDFQFVQMAQACVACSCDGVCLWRVSAASTLPDAAGGAQRQIRKHAATTDVGLAMVDQLISASAPTSRGAAAYESSGL